LTDDVDTKALRELLVPGEINEHLFRDIEETVFSSPKRFDELHDVLRVWETEDLGATFHGKTEASLVRGYCHYLNGELERAEDLLRNTRNDPWGYYWFTRVVLDMDQREKARELADKARERYPEFPQLVWLVAEAWLLAGRDEEAEKILEGMSGPQRESSAWFFLRGRLCEVRGDYADAIDFYRRSADAEVTDARALFRLGVLCALYGDASEAVACYEACVQLVPVHVNALINLGVLYEDLEYYERAVRCYRTILSFYPNHPRAKLYLTDALASTSQFYDREHEKEISRQNQILRIPITDFELSVRSRNCLAKMNIDTLGDLIMKTEPELLSSKNFGETSLMEIKAILAQKGLRLGQGLEDRVKAEKKQIEEMEKGVDPEVLNRPIESLNLSIRSRRCMERLKVQAIRDLIHKSEVELMSAKNFGLTSLNEVNQKLAELGLKLRA
jgi:DNA-directed RNA polymerase subunit alpha